MSKRGEKYGCNQGGKAADFVGFDSYRPKCFSKMVCVVRQIFINFVRQKSLLN